MGLLSSKNRTSSLNKSGFSRAKTSKGLETNTDCKAQLGKLHSLSKMQSDSGNESAGTEDDDDVIFHVGLDTVMRIPAKRSVLSKKNEVFQAMFCGPYTQARENLRRRQASVNNGEILIPQNHLVSSHPDHIYDPDVDGRAFKNLISFLYGETVELRSVTTAMETLHAAEKYLCDGLMKMCSTYLAGQLNIDNVLHIYQRTCMYPEAGNRESVFAEVNNQPSAPPLEEFNAPNNVESPSQAYANEHEQSRSSWCSFLLNSCLEFIDKNASAVLRSEEFEELDVGKVESIVVRDGLHLHNEIEVLTALIRWSVFECHRRQLDPRANNQRFVLGHLVWHVRFSIMSSAELQQAMTILDALEFKEFVTTLQTCGNNSQLANRLRDNYPLTVTKPRMYLTSKVDTVNKSVPVDDQTVSSSNRKTCLTEKFFVCLACIFE